MVKTMVWCQWKRATGVVLGISLAWQLIHISLSTADIYVYRDTRGIVHFTNVPTKPVYRPFLLLRRYMGQLRGKKPPSSTSSLQQHVNVMAWNSPW